MNIREAKKIIISLSKPEKMPGYAYGIPAPECKTGSKLRLIPNSVCSGCYALKGNYTRFPEIMKSQYKRLAAISSPLWVEAMAIQIQRQKWFRWHDAGDLQSVDHLEKIFEVCRRTPNTRHWLPTQERQYILAVNPEEVPDNLIIRLSGAKVDGAAPKAWAHTSTVVTDGAPSCPSGTQGGKCLDCRACWNKDISNISYGKH